MSQLIIIFVKNPVRGRVKTRLAAHLGDDRALDIYLKLLRHTHQAVLPVPAEKRVFFSDRIDNDLWEEDLFDRHVQLQVPDLGARMADAFNRSVDEFEKVVIIGSDCPELLPGHILEAFQELDEHDLVLGPSTDGGYYLLGCRSFYADIFRNIDWSTSLVLQQTLKVARKLDLKVHLLEQLTDVDRAEDLSEFPEL